MKPQADSPDLASFAGERFSAAYLVQGSESEARASAELICIDQTVEAAEEALTPAIRAHLLGRIESFAPTAGGGYRVGVSYPAALFGQDCAQLLNVLFGTSSLRRNVQLIHFDLPPAALVGWAGPRFGLRGLRECLGVWDRPLVCAVLKPLGRFPRELSELAEHFVLGGVDLVKDDQGLADHPFCPFEERVARCADSVASAARRRGRRCLYAPHISGSADNIRGRAGFAKRAGAGGLLIAPGLTGFDAVRTLAADDELALPILCHPAMLGIHTATASAGIAPSVLFGQLPRLAGADASIYPSYGTGYAMERADCAAVADACRRPWGPIEALFPTAAGRMGLRQLPELCEFYGREVLFILGSAIHSHPKGIAAACEEFLRAVAAQSASQSSA